jgi:hypothetical protein
LILDDPSGVFHPVVSLGFEVVEEFPAPRPLSRLRFWCRGSVRLRRTTRLGWTGVRALADSVFAPRVPPSHCPKAVGTPSSPKARWNRTVGADPRCQ